MKAIECVFIPKHRYDKQQTRLTAAGKLIVCLLLVIGVLTGLVVNQAQKKAEAQTQYNQLLDVLAKQNAEQLEEEQAEEPMAQPIPSPQLLVDTSYIGEYTITYYCSCEQCCGEYGINRPIVDNKEVVVTSTGAYAQEGITIAVDPNKIPYGSLLYIEGVGYRIAQDCGGAIKGNRIDVYMDSHEEAIQQGKHESKIYIITTGGTQDE